MKQDEIAIQINESIKALRAHLDDPSLQAKFRKDPIKAFLDSTPKKFQDQVTPAHKKLLRKMIATKKPKTGSEHLVAASFLGGPTWCQVAIYTGIVVAFAGFFVISAGALVAPLIAAEAGFIPVIAAMTGLSEGAVSAAASVGGLTIGGLVSSLCEEMNK